MPTSTNAVDASVTEAVQGKGPLSLTEVRYWLTPHSKTSLLRERHEPLRVHLEKVWGVPVRLEVATDYDTLVQHLRSGAFDLVELSPYAFVRAQNESVALSPLANVIADGATSGAGYIVVRSDSSVRTLEDLRGKTLALVDPSSTTGYLYPMKLLLDKRLDPFSHFSRTEFLGNHESALMAVHEGRADAAATYQGALHSLEQSHAISPLSFRIIAKTGRSPRDLFCANGRLSSEAQASMRAGLLGIDGRTPEGRAVLSSLRLNGFAPADDSLYEPVRAAERQLALARQRK
jgi:phosphonate transport system substrate-binding protein